MELYYQRLNNYEAFDMWCSFCFAMGIETAREMYGNYWPRRPLEGEIVFAWYERELGSWANGNIVGWVAIRKDLLEPVMWVIAGVFPEFQNKGYMSDIFYKSLKIGFDIFQEVRWSFSAISNKNPRYIEHHNKLVSEGKWVRVGEINIPEPGYTIFGLNREIFRSEQ